MDLALRLPKSRLRSLVIRELRRRGRLKGYGKLAYLEGELEAFEKLFEKGMGSKLLSIQRSWARQILRRRSIAIVAPTGIGKTSFGVALLAYYASKGMRCYMVLPTSLLVKQVHSRILSFINRAGLKDIGVVAYHSLMTGGEAKDAYRRISERDFRILVTTSFFLSRRFELLEGLKFDLIFVDDVDSFLRTSKNVDKVLRLLGFPGRIVEAGFKLIDARRSLKAAGREAEEVREYVDSLQSEILEFLRRGKHGILVVSGASVRARRTKRVMLFRELLNFEVGGRFELLRNVEDTYVKPRRGLEEEVLRVVRRLGGGGLVFVPMDRGAEFVDRLARYLNDKGVKAYAYVKPRRRILEEFTSGVYDVLVGVASFRSPLARGLDLPHRVRYAVFAGVPKLRVDLSLEGFKPGKTMILLSHLRDYASEKEKLQIDYYLTALRRYSSMISDLERRKVEEALLEKVELEGFLGKVQRLYEEIVDFVKDFTGRPEVRKALEESPRLVLEKGEKLSLLIPDPVGYIQGSGRTSRLYSGGLSKGLSVVIVDEPKAFNGLIEEVSWYIEDLSWKPFESIDLDRIMKRIDEERRFIARLISGEVKPEEVKDVLKTALLVVESPNKAKTIARFFGRPLRKRRGILTVYEVNTGTGFQLSIAASGGHIYDLVTDVGFHGVLTENGYYIPVYDFIKRCRLCGEQYVEDLTQCPVCGAEVFDKRKIVESLKEAASEVDLVLVGTDADAEGEKIGWDIAHLLSPYTGELKRVEFHEITRRAILEALGNPRSFSVPMVEAQMVRRIEDRWIGFELSSRVQKVFGRPTLSAGRVQTVVLGWVVDRYEESKASIRDFFRVTLENGLTLTLEKPRMERRSLEEFTSALQNAEAEVKVEAIEEVEVKPPPPFSTDSMLSEATSTLNLSSDEVMKIAQDLFELGLITYHRTDSVRVSDVGRALARRYIEEKFGSEASQLYKPRVWGVEGAHECIRPTRPVDVDRLRQLIVLRILRLPKALTSNHYKLYKLIFDRFIGSQMVEARAVKAYYTVRLLDSTVKSEGFMRIVEPGFTLVKPLPVLPENLEGVFKVSSVYHRRGSTVRLYTESDLVRLMRERGVGRPSTYAKIVSTLFRRRYVVKVGRGYLVPTSLGRKVYRFLKENYGGYVSEETTRRLEEAMKAIEEEAVSYLDVLRRMECEIRSIVEPPSSWKSDSKPEA